MKWAITFKFYKEQGLAEYTIIVTANSHGEASRMVPSIMKEEGITRHKGNPTVKEHKLYDYD